MAKRILAVVFSCLAVLVVLVLFVIIVIRFGDFFGVAITVLLVGFIVALMLFVGYIMVSMIVDAVQRHKLDDDSLNEQTIEMLLYDESERQKATVEVTQSFERVQPPGGQAEQRSAAPAPRQETEYRPSPLAANGRTGQLSVEAAAPVPEPQPVAEPEPITEPVEPESVAEPLVEPEPMAEPEPAPPPIQPQPPVQPVPPPAPQPPLEPPRPEPAPPPAQADPQREEMERKTAELRRSQAIASARKQAEAVAAARRKAAQTAARTQAYSQYHTQNLPRFNSSIIQNAADVAGVATPLAASVPPAHMAEGVPRRGDTIWEQMQVRQSAAPVLEGGSPAWTTGGFTATAGHFATGQMPAPQLTGQLSLTGQLLSFGRTAEALAIPGLPAEERPAGAPAAQPPPAEKPRELLKGKPASPLPTPPRPAQPVQPAPPLQPAPSVQPAAPERPAVPVPPVQPQQPARPVEQPPRQTAQPGVEQPSPAQSQFARPPAPPPVQSAPAVPAAARPAPAQPSLAQITGQFAPPARTTGQFAPPAQTTGQFAPPVRTTGQFAPPVQTTGQFASSAQPAGSLFDTPPTTRSKLQTTGQIPIPRKQGDTGRIVWKAGQTGQIPAINTDGTDPPKRPRGRPPKPRDPEEENKPKRPRGRPPKPKDPEEENKPKRPRGRPPKPRDPEEENKPKRPRGRPRKDEQL